MVYLGLPPLSTINSAFNHSLTYAPPRARPAGLPDWPGFQRRERRFAKLLGCVPRGISSAPQPKVHHSCLIVATPSTIPKMRALTASATVGILDLLTLLANWGPCA